MRRLSLATRISLAIFGVAGLTLLLLYVAAARILDSVLLEREVAGIRAQSRLLVPVIQGLARTPEDLDRTLREAPGFAGREELRLEVLGPELETLYPSGIQPATAWLGYERLKDLADHGGDIGVVERLRGPGGVSSLLALTPLPEPGWLLVVSGLSDMERRREDLTTVMVLVAVLSWILVGAAGLVMLRRWVIRPVRRMTALAERVAEGDELRVLDQAATQGADELAAMGRALAAMARRLAEDRERIGRQVEELEDMNRSLETARERLVRSETLASVGSLAAGVAHEIGNPVGIIVGYLEMLLEDASDPGMRETLLKIQGATLRIDQTIRDMLNFA
ncbi:MAG: HAMP domain-containing protein, partial [Deltaproteobacteria bacterium]|nr:HAMP domain-containing protein [Deltaproteobacteria bacterium]